MSPSASSGRPGWRETSAKRRQASRAAKLARRWITTVLVVLLIVAFVWLLIPARVPQTYMIGVCTRTPGKLAVPPVPFATEDFDAFDTLPDVAFERREDLNSPATIGNLGGRLAAIRAHKEDVVIVYVAAHGVSEGDAAYLLCSDFEPGADATIAVGGCPLKRLLEQMSQSEAPVNLLILDCGHLAVDGRLGMLVNEFPRLLARDVQAVPNERLWVLTSSGMFQKTNVAYGRRRTVFGLCVEEALRGQANTPPGGAANGDDQIALSELYRYVADRLRDWEEPHGDAAQRPLLMRGGIGIVDPRQLEEDPIVLSLRTAPDSGKDDESSPGETGQNQPSPAGSADVEGHRPRPRGASERQPVGGQALARSHGGALALLPSPALARLAFVERAVAQSDRGVSGRAVEQPGGPTAPSPAAESNTRPPDTGQGDAPADSSAVADPSAGQTSSEKSVPTAGDDTAPGGEKGAVPGGDAAGQAEEPDTGIRDAGKTALPDTPLSVAGSESDPRKALRESILRAWQLRDRLQDRRLADGGWTPVDFAPHLWRELNARLLQSEKWYLAGAAYDNEIDILLKQVEELREGLDQLQTYVSQGEMPAARLPREGSVAARLIDAWRTLLVSGAKEQFDLAANGLGRPDLLQALREYHDLLFLAPYYVTWHDDASLATTRALAARSDISSMLDLLQQFQVEHLAATGKHRLDLSGQRDLLRDWQRIRDVRRKVDQRIGEEAEHLVDGQWQVIPLETPADERRVANQLGTPLLPAARRKALLEALLLEGREAPPRRQYPSSNAGTDVGGQPGQWQQLGRRAELHARLLVLADPAKTVELERKYLGDIRSHTPPRKGNESGLLRYYRGFGSELLAYYGTLPEKIRRHDTGGPSIPEKLRLATLMDARDVLSLGSPAELIPEFPFEAVVGPGRFVVEGPGGDVRVSIQSDDQPWTPVAWVVGWSARGKHGVEAFLEFDDRLIAVRTVPARHKLSPGERLGRMEISSESTWPPPFEVKALVDRETSAGVASTPLQLRLEPDETEGAGPPQIVGDALAIHCLLPRPDRVDLLVAARIAPHAREPDPADGFRLVRQEADGVTLRLFPNRKTHFRLSLANRFDEDKTVNVALVAAPGLRQGAWPRGRLFEAGGRIRPEVEARLLEPGGPSEVIRLLPNAQVLSKNVEPIVLPADSSGDGHPTPVMIDLTPLAGMDPKPGDSATEAAAAEAAPPSPPVVTDGLACVITEVDSGHGWIHWIALDPLAPKDYLRPAEPTVEPTMGYVERLSGVAVTLQAKRPDLFPLGCEDNPIPLVWDTAKLSPDEVPREAELADATGSAGLFVPVPPDGRYREVLVSADGYPRAFVYRVLCGEGRQGEDIEPSLESVAVTELSAPDFPKIYRFTESGNPPAVPEKAPEGKQIVYFRSGDAGAPAAFPATTRRLFVKLRADAPEGLAYWIDVGLAGTGIEGIDLQRFYRDRQFVARLADVGQDGLAVIETDVHDFDLVLNLGGQVTERMFVDVRLTVDGGQGDETRQPILIDGRKPQLREVRVVSADGGAVREGSECTLQLRVEDLSGVERIEFGFDKNKNRAADNDELFPPYAAGDGLASGTFRLKLPTKDLPVDIHTLFVRAIDKVGHESEWYREEVAVVPPKTDPPPVRTKGVIQGTIKYRQANPRYLKGFRVTVSNTGLEQKTGEGGKFRFRDLEQETYTLEAEGFWQGKVVRGKVEGVKPSDPESPKSIVIELRDDRDEDDGH